MRLLDLGVEPVETLLAPKTGRVALSNHDQCPSISHLARPMKVEFDYTRSLGPVLSQFMIGQRRRQGTGSVLSDGTGVVRTWSWVPEPAMDDPLDKPFAVALVPLDGADAPCCTRSTWTPPPTWRPASGSRCAGPRRR